MKDNNKKVLRHKLVHENKKTIETNTNVEKVSGTSFKVYNDGKSKLPGTIFLIIVILLGAYVINDQFYKDKNDYNFIKRVEQEPSLTKIDATKNYVYLKEEEILTDNKIDITYTEAEVVFNTNDSKLKELEKEINDKIDENHKTYAYSSEILDTKSKYNTSIKYLSKFEYNEVLVYESDKYASVIVISHTINVTDTNTINKIDSYIIDLSNGKIYNNKEILSKFKTTEEEAKEDITTSFSKAAYFVNSDRIGMIYDSSDNLLGYSTFLTKISEK